MRGLRPGVPPSLAFAQRSRARLPHLSCPWLRGRPVSRRISIRFTLRPAEWLASRPGPAPLGAAETFTSELSPPGSPRDEGGYDYAATWTRAAVGLSPTGRMLLLAATSLIRHLSPRDGSNFLIDTLKYGLEMGVAGAISGGIGGAVGGSHDAAGAGVKPGGGVDHDGPA